MHPYIPHLISDIKEAHRQETDKPEEPAFPKSFEEEMEEIENWVMNDPEHDFSYYCGLKPEQFPPAHQLTTDEMELVCKAYEEMMKTWNLDVDFPDTLPTDRYYELLIGTLTEKTTIVNTGFSSFDYCSGYAPDCIFKEHCPCLKYWNEDEG